MGSYLSHHEAHPGPTGSAGAGREHRDFPFIFSVYSVLSVVNDFEPILLATPRSKMFSELFCPNAIIFLVQLTY